MSDRRADSPSSRMGGMSGSNLGVDLQDGDQSPRSHGREKFRKERSLERERASYIRNNDDYDHDRKKRHRRSITPPDDQRYSRRRVSPSPTRGSYSSSARYSRGHDRDFREPDYPYQEGDHYIPNYERDGYAPAPRYSSLNEPSNSSSSYGYNGPDMMNMPMMGGGGGWSPMSRLPPIDLDQLDYTVSFKQFHEHLRYTNPHSYFDDEEVQKRYSVYKEKAYARQLSQFFNNNKDKQWFQEKYHPVTSLDRVEDIKKRRRELFNLFMTDLHNGNYDTVQYDEPTTPEMEEMETERKQEGETEKSAPGKEANDGASSLSQQDNTQQADECQLIIKTVPPTIPRQKIVEMCSKVKGFRYVVLSEPSPNRKFHRIGWICFEKGTDMHTAFKELDNQKIEDFVFHLAMNQKSQNQSRTPKTAPEITNTPERLQLDAEKSVELARTLDAELGDDIKGVDAVLERARTVSEKCTKELAEKEDADRAKDGTQVSKVKKDLDMIIAYLRHVHMFCYYCCLECDSLEELNRRCVDPHCRRVTTATLETADGKQQSARQDRSVSQWLKNFDQKLNMRCHKVTGLDLSKLGGKLLEKETEAYIKEHVLKEHEAKFKCQVGDCSKAFKGFEYVEKHILAKHKEEIEKIKVDVEYYNRYVCDPNHLLPSSGGVMQNAIKVPGNGGMFMSSFAMHSMPPMQAAAAGTPWDRIPRIGFGDSAQWSGPGRRLPPGTRNAGMGGRGKSSTSMNFDEPLPQDPRQVKSYVDLDAPAEGEAEISFY